MRIASTAHKQRVLANMEALVRLPDDSTLSVAVSPRSSIATLKSSIQLRAGIPIPLQQLSVQGKKLKDQDRAVECLQEVTVQVASLSGFLIRLIVRESSGITYKVGVRGDSYIWYVKTKIHELRGIEAKQQRLYSDKQLLGERQTVSEVCRCGNFLWELLQPSEFYCSVATSTGSCYQVSAAPSHRVSRVVNKLRQFECFDCRYQTIKCEGKEVNCADLLSDIKTSDTITLMCEAPSFCLWFTTLNVPSRRIEISSVEPILPHVPLQSTQPQCPAMWILHRGKVLSPTATPSESGLASGAIIEYGDLLVHIRSFNIEKLDLALFSYSHIATLKREVQRRLGRNTFKLMYCGSELNENRTFKDCGFTSEVTIEMIELTDNYSWVESEYDKIIMACNVEDAVREFNRKTGNNDSFDLTVLDRKDCNYQRQRLTSGGMLQLYKSELKTIVFVEVQDTTLRIIMNKADTLEKLLIQLRPIISIIGFENTDNSDLIESIGTKPLRAIIDNRRFIEFRFADGETEILPFDPSESVLELKRRLKNYSESIEFAYNDTLLNNDKRFGEYYIEETEYVEVCRKTEVVVWTHHTNGRLFIPLPSFDQTLSDLHAMCHRLFPEPLLLFSNGFLPDNSETLSSRGIGPGCCIHMIPNSLFTSVIETSPDPDKFIFISLCKGDVFLLSFSHRSTLSGIMTPLRKQFTVSFSLILENHLLTNYRFSRIKSGSTVQLFTPSDAVLFQRSSGVVSPVYISPTEFMYIAMEMGNIPITYSVFKGRESVDVSKKAERSEVVYLVNPGGSVWTVNTASGRSITFNLPSVWQPKVSDLISAVKQAECDSLLSPRIYASGNPCDDCSQLLTTDETYSLLYPSELLIKVIYQSRTPSVLFALETDSVGTLRKRISQKLEIHLMGFRLFHNTDFLYDDTALLQTFNFEADNNVTVLDSGNIVVIICGSKAVAMYADCSTKFGTLRLPYFASNRIHADHSKLVCDGRILNDEETVGDYSTDSISVCRVINWQERLVQVRLSDGKLCSRIAAAKSVSISTLQTIANGCYLFRWFGELSNSLSLSDYKLGDNATLFLLEKPRKEVANFNLFLAKDNSNSLVHLQTYRFSIIQDVKRRVSAASGILALDGYVVDETKSIKECGFEDGQIVYMLTDDCLLITVEYEFQKVTFTVAKTSTGKELKAKMSEMLDIPVTLQQLYCGEQVLKDDMKAVEVAAERSILAISLSLLEGFVTIHSAHGPAALLVSSAVVTVAELKQEFQKQVPINTARYRLLANSAELADADSISTKALSAYTHLALLTAKDIRLSVKSPFCVYHLFVKKSDSVLSVLKKVQRKVGMHHSRLRLMGSMEVEGGADIELVQKTDSQVLSFSARRP